MAEWVSNALFLLVLFVSNTIQILTGFAGNMLAMPPSIRLIGMNEARAVLNVFTLFACLIVWWKNRQFVNRSVFYKIILYMIFGMFLGMWLIQLVPTGFLLKAYAFLIIAIALYKMLGRKPIPLPHFCMILIILLAGVIHGMFVSGGALLVIYAVSVLKDKNAFRATLAPVWVVLAIILIFNHASNGYFTPRTMELIVLSIVPLVASLFLGNQLFRRIPQGTFLKITYVLLLISGLSLL